FSHAGISSAPEPAWEADEISDTALTVADGAAAGGAGVTASEPSTGADAGLLPVAARSGGGAGGGAILSGVNASMRRQAMTNPAYSSGASDNSLRLCTATE